MKIYVKNENQLSEEFCESVNCSGEPQTEDEGCCTGCTGRDQYVDDNFQRVVSECNKDRFVAVDEVIDELKKLPQLACLESSCATRHDTEGDLCQNCKTIKDLFSLVNKHDKL